ncbi:MAG: PQQ-binding-like beta-propeller repeat protein, partial [Chloroflexi bacterium]|nr:PQQ-binding-like beta-propeller repeat protein [Chloroflexota bacterium]
PPGRLRSVPPARMRARPSALLFLSISPLAWRRVVLLAFCLVVAGAALNRVCAAPAGSVIVGPPPAPRAARARKPAAAHRRLFRGAARARVLRRPGSPRRPVSIFRRPAARRHTAPRPGVPRRVIPGRVPRGRVVRGRLIRGTRGRAVRGRAPGGFIFRGRGILRPGRRSPAAGFRRGRPLRAKPGSVHTVAPVEETFAGRVTLPAALPPVPEPPGPAVAGAVPMWQPGDEWRMIGANDGHTARVNSRLHLPLRLAWAVTAAQLGAGPGPAVIHPRAIAGKTVLVEMELPGSIVLGALDAATGRVRWTRSFSSPGFFPDAGLFHAPQGCHTLFRPVVQAGTQLLVTPDFFGRPPLVAFDVKSGVMQWRSNAGGGDPPVVLDDPRNPVALTADYAGGRPVMHATILSDGTAGPALVGEPAGVGPDWAGGLWDVQVRWADPTAALCCLSGGRLRVQSSWPSASWVLSTPGAARPTAWETLGQGSLAGPVEDGSVFLRQVTVHGGVKLAAMARVNLENGHTIWARTGDNTPMIAAPEILMGRNSGGQLTAWLAATGEPAWFFPAQGMQGCIAGEGQVIASYGDPVDSGAAGSGGTQDSSALPSSEDAAVAAFR